MPKVVVIVTFNLYILKFQPSALLLSFLHHQPSNYRLNTDGWRDMVLTGADNLDNLVTG